MWKRVAVVVDNPNNIDELNKYLAQGYDVTGSYPAKNTTVFVLSIYMDTPRDVTQRDREYSSSEGTLTRQYSNLIMAPTPTREG